MKTKSQRSNKCMRYQSHDLRFYDSNSTDVLRVLTNHFGFNSEDAVLIHCVVMKAFFSCKMVESLYILISGCV